MRIQDYTVSQFFGLNTFIKDVKTLKSGVASRSKNWLTAKFGDHIELRRGTNLLGQTRVSGGAITGLGVGVKYDGTQIPFWSRARKIEYYDAATDDRKETGSDLLPVGASGEDVWFAPYQNLAGSFIYCGSPTSGIFKIPVANPDSAVDQAIASFRFASLRFGQGRSRAGQRNGTTAGNNDKTGYYLSKLDHALLSDFTLHSSTSSTSLGNTDGSTKTFSTTFPLSASQAIKPGGLTVDDTAATETFTDNGNGVLTGSHGGTGTINYVTGLVSVTYNTAPVTGKSVTAHYGIAVLIGAAGATTYNGTLPIGAPQTCMYVSFGEVGGETFADDRNGALVGSQGSTGTINYATGAYTLAFNHLTTGIVTADFYIDDATQTVLNFDTSVLGAGLPKIFRQDDGGSFQTVFDFQSVDYCFHLLKTYAFTQALDDTSSTNLPYRNIGIAYPRSAHPEPEGILLIDTSNPTQPIIRRLEIAQNTTNLTIVPTDISEPLDLSGYAYAKGIAFRWGDYEIISLQEYVNGVANPYNSVTFVHNVAEKSVGAWDQLDYRISCAENYAGALIAGDPLSGNVFTLFSGFDDDDMPIDNAWQDGQLNLGTQNLKRAHFMRITGLIQKDQDIQVSLVLDGGTAVSTFLIQGDADYVDQGINTPIGSYTAGSKVIGGGGTVTAHPFDVTFPIHTDIFQNVSVIFEAQGIGHAEIDSYTYRDIRDKGRRSLASKISS